MLENISHEEVVTVSKQFIAAVAVEGKKIWMGKSITDDAFSSCFAFEQMMGELKQRSPKWANHECPESLIASVFERLARQPDSGIKITPRTGMVRGFHYYERDSNVGVTAPVRAPAQVLETV